MEPVLGVFPQAESVSIPGILWQTWALFCLKTRHFWNWITAGKSSWLITLASLFAVGWFIMVWTGATDFLKMIGYLALGPGMTFVLSLTLGYILTLLLVSDLFMGHTLNIGQVSTDHIFLSTLPIHPLALLMVKLYERMLSDWIGFFILLSAFLGVASRIELTTTSFSLAVVLFLQLEGLVGMIITIIYTLLQRFLRPSTLANTFSLMAYLGTGIAVLPAFWMSSNPRHALMWLVGLGGPSRALLDTFLMPLSWIVEALLRGHFTMAFWKWTLFWSISMGIGVALFIGLTRWNWFSYAHPGVRARASMGNAWFKGVFRKEFLLLKSDFNLLTNALFLPLTIIALEIWIFRDIVSLSTLPRAMGTVSIAALYFCMFGPINAVGSEGKAIGLLETLPQSGAQWLRQKTLVWTLIAETFFVPTTIITGRYLGLATYDQLLLAGWVSLLLFGFVWITISISAIFPTFDAKVLQKSSTLTGKFIAAMAMMIAMPIRDTGPLSLSCLAAFLLLGYYVRLKAIEALEIRLDPQSIFTPEFKLRDTLLVVFSVAGVHACFGAAAENWFGFNTTYWPRFWAFLLSLIILGKSTWSYIHPRFPSFRNALRFNGTRILWFAALPAGLLLAHVSQWYIVEMNARFAGILVPAQEFWERIRFFMGGEWAFGFTVLLWCVLTPLLQEVFYRGFLDQSLQREGWNNRLGIVFNGFLFALQYPFFSLPVMGLVGICCSWLFRTTRCLWVSIMFHVAFNSGVLAFLLLRFS